MAFICGKADDALMRACLKIKETGILEFDGKGITEALQKRGAVDANTNADVDASKSASFPNESRKWRTNCDIASLVAKDIAFPTMELVVAQANEGTTTKGK
jgi:hypothetical protein